jgi:hypothetical protein
MGKPAHISGHTYVLAGLVGIEPTYSGVKAQRVYQFPYKPIFLVARTGYAPVSIAYKAIALLLC